MEPIVIHEVGLRDGLQAERQVVPTAVKEGWIRQALASGLDLVQVGSFVHPDKVPQMADTDELCRRLGPRASGARRSALVLNERGLERALACDLDLICMGVSASDTHSRKNTGMATQEAQERIIAMARAALAAGRQVQVSVQSAFGCGFEGPVPAARVQGIVRHFRAAGLTRISLADTAGHGHPEQVRRLFGECAGDPEVTFTGHFHDTYGMGMANVYAAMAEGVRSFETSFGGLGGCPFTRVAAGNVATEDLVHGLQRAGSRQDIQLDLLVALARAVAAWLGRDLPGRVQQTGPLSY